MRSGDPAARVLLAGLFPNASARGPVPGIPLRLYLPSIYRQKHARALFDGVDIHPYVRTPGRVLAEVKRTRKIMARFKDRRTPLWVGEMGWTTGGDPSPLTVSPQRQATYLRRAYELLAEKRLPYGISSAIWYSWRDVPGRAWFDHTGLFDIDGAPKPAWSAFVDLAGGSLTDAVSPLRPAVLQP